MNGCVNIELIITHFSDLCIGGMQVMQFNKLLDACTPELNKKLYFRFQTFYRGLRTPLNQATVRGATTHNSIQSNHITLCIKFHSMCYSYSVEASN